MPKKKNKKFRKDNRISTNHPSNNMDAISAGNNTVDENNDTFTEVSTRAIDTHHDFYQTDKYHHVKKDVFKILIIMISVIALLVVCDLIGKNTSIFSTVGDWIYKILNIQTT